MSAAWFAFSAACGLIAVLGGLYWRSRKETRRLRARLESAALDLQNLQMAFSRFAPDEVIERVIANGISEDGEKREVTALFADLVGFTALSEEVEPSVLVRVLNGYFDRMSQAITEHRGHVSTFIGDGILALFGALAPNPWQGNDAVQAALAMREALDGYNHELEEQGLPRLGVGIGLQRGTGVAGLVGSRNLKEFTFVGRTVNVAARVQELTREYRADILLTQTLRDTLDPRFVLRELAVVQLKGVSERVQIYAVEGFRAAPSGVAPAA